MRSPQEILREAKTIVVVGASPDPSRPSYDVMGHLLEAGYQAIPVRPDGAEVHGIPSVARLAEIEGEIDVVDVFRRPQYAPEIAREAVEAGAKALWLQMGIVSDEARAIAEEAGLDFVENACTKVVHKLYVA